MDLFGERTHTHTHLDKTYSTFCAKFMIMNVPSYLRRHQQLETKNQGEIQTIVDHHENDSMSLQVREESVLSSYHRNIVVSSLDADHNEPQHPPALK